MRAVDDTAVQLSIPLDSFEHVIERRADEALAEIRRMAAEAIEFINRSTGQHLRHIRARNQQFTVEISR